MIIEKEDTPLPEPVEPRTCSLIVFSGGDPEVNPRSYGMMVPQVEAHTLQKMRCYPSTSPKGTPTAFAITGSNHRVLSVWPSPDGKMHAIFRYCPAMRQI